MKFKTKIILLLYTILTLLVSISSEAKEKYNVLILSGSNNHNWQVTTPVIKSILEETELFKVSITEEPEKMNADLLKNYHLILSNWNLFPKTESNWPGEAKKAVLDFVEQGGGFVFVHAGSSANYDWLDFQKLAGATWGKATRHGKQEAFEVKVESFNHPIINGMGNFWTTDELWVNMETFNTTHVIGEAFAPKENKGSDKMEPVMFKGRFGKGRTFFLVLGHDEKAMRNLGFKTLLQRGSEWVVNGKVSQSIPFELRHKKRKKTGRLSWEEGKNSVTLYHHNQKIWQYNFSEEEGKPYFHPLSTLDGTNLTWLRPHDHPWHRAIWFSFKYINGINYWEEDRSTGLSEGITEIESVSYQLSKKYEAKFNLQLNYHSSDEVEVLKENRKVHVSSPQKDGSYCIDWESEFTAIADEVVLDRTPLPHEKNGKSYGGYAGFSARLNRNLWDVKAINSSGQTENLHGTTSEWMTYHMKNIKGEPVSITIFDHPTNVNFPNKWYVEKSTNHPFYYYSPAFIFDKKFILKKGERFTLKYRLLIKQGNFDVDKLNEVWKKFKSQ